MKLLILGAGAWGTALGIRAAGRHTVTLWARDARQAAAMQAQGENARYLPGCPLPAGLRVVAGPDALAAALAGAPDLIVVATPMAGLREWLTQLAGCNAPVAWLCKGLEAGTGRLAHEIQAAVAPGLRAGVLSGPSFALEVARGQPAALVAASAHAAVRERLVAVLHGPTLRVYENDDLAGVEVGGALKNVMAIACGLCDGLALGQNARAALITRGLAEMTRLGVALGGRAETFMGLSGLGDLVLTATGDLSRNRQVGLMLASGLSREQATDRLGHVAEGVRCAPVVLERAQSLGVDMPITAAVAGLLDGRLSPAQALAGLMEREPAREAAHAPRHPSQRI